MTQAEGPHPACPSSHPSGIVYHRMTYAGPEQHAAACCTMATSSQQPAASASREEWRPWHGAGMQMDLVRACCWHEYKHVALAAPRSWLSRVRPRSQSPRTA